MSNQEVQKIAFAGDWHANKMWAVQAILFAASHGADTIIHLGDYGYDFDPTFRGVVNDALEETDLTLQFVDGNHEDFSWLLSQPVQEDGRRQISDRVYHLPRGYRWEWDGVTFLALGGAFSVDRQWRVLGDSFWIEETITPEEVKLACEGGLVDVLVSHDCPSGVLIPGLERNTPYLPAEALHYAKNHRIRLRDVVDEVQPLSVWHGHYHIPYETRTDFGYGPVAVMGLGMDGEVMHHNVTVVDLTLLPRRSDGGDAAQSDE